MNRVTPWTAPPHFLPNTQLVDDLVQSKVTIMEYRNCIVTCTCICDVHAHALLLHYM